MRAKKMMAGCLAAALLAAQGSVVLAAQGNSEITTSPGETISMSAAPMPRQGRRERSIE